MGTHLFSNNARNTALAALAGVAVATVAKLLLDEATEAAARKPTTQADKYQQMQAAAHDPLYLADMQEINDDFAWADAETA